MLDKPPKRVRPHSAHVDADEEELARTRRMPRSDQPLRDARKLLRRHMVRTHEGVAFIPQPSIKRFWLSEKPLQEFFDDLRLEVSSANCHKITTKYHRIFTALVFVEWDSEYRFRQVFREAFPDDATPVWTDEWLISGGDFGRSDSLELSADEANSLNSTRNLVSVLVLEMNNGNEPYPGHIPLPITTKTEIGKGAYGKVYRIQIAAGCLQVENVSGEHSPNEAEQTFALKEMEASESRGELDFLREYRDNSRKSNFIQAHWAIIERNDQASVIYPLAAGDLQKLLEGKLEQDEEQFGDTVKRYQWREHDREQFCDIVRKSCNLADGLDFLHTNMHKYSNLVCRHGDLKPNNFLIFPTGWRISDMGLARVKSTSDEEEGVRKTTKTSLKEGCGPYAAPEMSGEEGTLIGRETDVWSLAAIIMELMIWGFGGPVAWTNFAGRRVKSSKGLFHDNGALSKAVDDELRSWPGVHYKTISAHLGGNDEQASKVLKELVKALSGAFEIDAHKRSKAKDLLDSMERVLKHFESPLEVEPQIRELETLEISPSSSTAASSLLQRKFKQHRQHKIFKHYFKPKQHIRISNEMESVIRKWLRQPTPSALCMVQEGVTQWRVSAITHEVYYTARLHNYKVVDFLTLDHYCGPPTSLQVSLDFVHLVISQLLRIKGTQDHDLDGLAVEASTLTDEARFEAAVTVLGKVIEGLGQDRKDKPVIVIVDEFWQVCPRMATNATKEQWKRLFALLGCAGIRTNGEKNAYSSLVAPHFRVLIRASGWFSDLQNLGFSGAWCTPSSTKYGVPTFRGVLDEVFKNSA